MIYSPAIMFIRHRGIASFQAAKPFFHRILRRLISHSRIPPPSTQNQISSTVPTSNAANSVELLHAHLKSGNMGHARNLFDKMTERSIVTWTMMIHGFARHGYFAESMRLFSQMLLSGLVPNSFTMVAVLVSAAGVASFRLAQAVHGRIVKAGLESELHVGTALLDVYAKCGGLFDSQQVFEQMSVPSLVSFNAMITGFVRGGFPEKTILLFNDIWKSGLGPNSTTMLSVIQACILLGSVVICECVHCYVIKSGLCSSVDVENSVLDMYLNLGNLAIGAEIFDRMEHKDVVSWTIMIGFLVSSECPSAALNAFHQMRSAEIDPDMVTMVNLISASAQLRDLRVGRLIHGQGIVSGFGLELPVVNSLISMYSKCRDLGSAKSIFYSSTKKCLISWTTLIAGYVLHGQPNEALQLLFHMRYGGMFVMDPILMVTLGTACGELASLKLCEQIHGYAVAACFQSHIAVQNTVVAAYAKCGNVERSRKIFKVIEHRDVVSWNSLIYGYGINGDGRAAVALFYEMLHAGQEPDSASYLCVLTACSHSGVLEDGLAIFDRMVKENKVTLREEHCGCVVDILARTGRLEEAREYGNRMPQEASGNVWKAILGGCRIHDNVKLAEVAGKKVLGYGLNDSGNVVLLSNVYKSVGRFVEAEALWMNMKGMELMKNHGISLLDAR